MGKKRKKSNKKKIILSEIKYYEQDLEQLTEFIDNFKEKPSIKKKSPITKGKLKSFVQSLNDWADTVIPLLGDKIFASTPATINSRYYKYYAARNKFPLYEPLFGKLEEKMDILVKAAAIAESGKMHDIRQKLVNPQCISLAPFLKDPAAYFNMGIKGIVNIDNYIFVLDLFETFVNKRIEREQNRSRYRRMFYIHAGKTNSGKTYTSMQMLKKAETGVYLSPLRLLALEISDNLNSQGIKCSFMTGEEEILVDNATHISSTVELADFSKDYDVAVIDECQMISDFSRGHAWTKAIMNIRAREICLCTAPEAVDVLVRLVDSCGDYYQIINHRRTTPLVAEKTPFSIDDVQPGDALVAFSKQKVNAIGAQLINKGINVSILYGALPYTVRRQQFENFLSGKSSVLVTTDAIGMGVNLPVRRIVFMEVYKFDGQQNRLLASGEIKQIAGRAGRRGIFNTGFVNANGEKELKYIRKSLNCKTEKVAGICVNFPKRILYDESVEISDAIKAWEYFCVPQFYIKESLNDAVYNVELIARIYERLNLPVNKLEIFETATMPVDIRVPQVKSLWLEYVQMRITGCDTLRKPFQRGNTVDDFLVFSKLLDTYFMCSKSWNLPYDNQWLTEKRLLCNAALIDNLIDDVEKHTKYCLKCGKILEWNSREKYCDECLE